MKKNQINSIYNLILGMGFLIISNLVAIQGKSPSWIGHTMLGIALFHLIVAGFQRVSQKYDENGKPL